jgi:hypothetical protein
MAVHSERSSPLKAPKIARFDEDQLIDSSNQKESLYQSNILCNPNAFRQSSPHQTNLVLKADMSNLVQQYERMNND